MVIHFEAADPALGPGKDQRPDRHVGHAELQRGLDLPEGPQAIAMWNYGPPDECIRARDLGQHDTRARTP